MKNKKPMKRVKILNTKDVWKNGVFKSFLIKNMEAWTKLIQKLNSLPKTNHARETK